MEIIVIEEHITSPAAPLGTNRSRWCVDDAIRSKAVVVLARVGRLVAHRLEQMVERSREESAQRRPHKEDPEIVHEVPVHESGSQAPRGIDGCARVVDP